AAAADGKQVRIHGVDIAAAMIERGRERLGDLPNVELHVGNGYDLGSFADAAVEVVYSVFAFQHMPKPIVLNYFAEVHRVLRPEGVFWFQVPNVLQDQHMHALNHFSQPWYVEHPYPMHFYTAFEVVKMLRYRHFAVERIEEGMKVWARKTEGPGITEEVIEALGELSWGPLGVVPPRPRSFWRR
ncbi:MAG: class I SAM-dependent methyltransferase, partial [Actinomycetota bacterium]